MSVTAQTPDYQAEKLSRTIATTLRYITADKPNNPTGLFEAAKSVVKGLDDDGDHFRRVLNDFTLLARGEELETDFIKTLCKDLTGIQTCGDARRKSQLWVFADVFGMIAKLLDLTDKQILIRVAIDVFRITSLQETLATEIKKAGESSGMIYQDGMEPSIYRDSAFMKAVGVQVISGYLASKRK